MNKIFLILSVCISFSSLAQATAMVIGNNKVIITSLYITHTAEIVDPDTGAKTEKVLSEAWDVKSNLTGHVVFEDTDELELLVDRNLKTNFNTKYSLNGNVVTTKDLTLRTAMDNILVSSISNTLFNFQFSDALFGNEFLIKLPPVEAATLKRLLESDSALELRLVIPLKEGEHFANQENGSWQIKFPGQKEFTPLDLALQK